MRIKTTTEPIVSRAISIFGWKKIYVGHGYIVLPYRQRKAVIEHERAHIIMHHTEQRILCLLFAPFLYRWLCHRQEYAADGYVVEQGHGIALMQYLRNDADASMTHPSEQSRREKIALALSTSRTIPARYDVIDHGVI